MLTKSLFTHVLESLKEHSVQSDVLKAEPSPRGLLSVEYPESSTVALGNVLSPAATQSVPRILFTLNPELNTVIEPSDRFALVFTDPDAPSRADNKWSEYCHWIVTDLKLTPTDSAKVETNEFAVELLATEINLAEGRELIPYMGPGPPPGTGLHRYVFLLVKTHALLETPKDRPNWGTGIPGAGFYEWLNGRGDVWGVNFYQAKNESN